MKKILRTLILSMSATASLSAFADMPDGDVYIDRIIYGGNGCPQGSVSELMSPDLTAFTLLFDEYIAEMGPGIPRSENRKACQVTVNLVVPPGWSYSLATLDYRGFANLDPGVVGSQVASYYFQGQGRTGQFKTNLRGGYDDNYHVRDEIGLESSSLWSPCNATRALSIKSEVRLSGRGNGLMTIDSLDGQFKQIYGLRWRRC